MTVEAIDFLAEGTRLNDIISSSAKKPDEPSFLRWMDHEMSQINNQINHAEQTVQNFAVGKEDNLHQVMISVEKAKLSFELAVQVRNKLLEGYQEIMRMQI
jgi:flagellar hook-basal body complex protein FliE